LVIGSAKSELGRSSEQGLTVMGDQEARYSKLQEVDGLDSLQLAAILGRGRQVSSDNYRT
jgi:hypothetical protein